MARKTKYKRRASKYKGIKVSTNPVAADDRPETLREKFPSTLVNAYVKVVGSNWSETMYKKYITQAKKFLGKEKYKDKLICSSLVVQLYRACHDLIIQRKQKIPIKILCNDHPKYKALRTPRSECKKCWAIYNGKKTKKKTKAKNKGQKGS